MKITLLVDDYLPSTKSAPLMMQQLGQALGRRGHQVSIITPSGKLAEPTRETCEDGMKIIRFRSGRLKNIGKIRRACNELMLPLLLLWYWLRHPAERRADFIITYSPSIFWGVAVGALKLFYPVKNYLILRDIFPQWAVDSGILKKHSPITLFFRLFEQINYAAADKIAVQSPGGCSYFQGTAYGKKVTVLFNWFEVVRRPEIAGDMRQKYGLQDKIVFFYGGNIGLAQDMENLLRLARSMKAFPEAYFLFVGQGDACDMIQARIAEWDLTNTRLLPAVPQQEYRQMLAQCDVGMITLHHAHKTQNIPGKLLGYMSLKKPVLASVNAGNDLLQIIPEYQAGLVSVNPDDAALFTHAAAMLDAAKRQQMGEGAYRLLQNKFDVEKIAAEIVAAMTC